MPETHNPYLVFSDVSPNNYRTIHNYGLINFVVATNIN